MANGHGGYRRPANPAPVSGPGALSRRTDGRQPVMDTPDAAYGENQTNRELQSQSPLPQAPGAPSGPPPGPTPPGVGLGDPSQQPGVPVTSGAAAGAGPGLDALGLLAGAKADAQHFARYMPALLDIADRDDTPPSVRRAIRNLYSNL